MQTVGATDGAFDGAGVREVVGLPVEAEGDLLGELVGLGVGDCVGSPEVAKGERVGLPVGA